MLGFWVLGHTSFGGTQFSTCVTLMRPFLSAGTVVGLVAQLRLTLCHPMDCSPPGFSVHGIFQARILERAGIFPTQRSNLGLLHRRQILYHLSHQGSPSKCQQVFKLPIS